jgi:hypothetical protein
VQSKIGDVIKLYGRGSLSIVDVTKAFWWYEVAQSMERSTRRVVCDLGVLFIISVLCFDFVTKKE